MRSGNRTFFSKSAAELVFLLLIVLLIGGSAGDAYATADFDIGTKQIEEENKDPYYTQYKANYYLDSNVKISFKMIFVAAFDYLSNLIFSFQLLLANLLLMIYKFSLNINLYSVFGDFIDAYILAMKESVFDKFMLFFIALFSICFIINLMRNRTTQIITGLLQMILVLSVALLFFYYPGKIVEGIDKLSNDISSTVMEGAYTTIAPSGGDGVSADQKTYSLVWHLMVHKPWQILEFGSVKTAEKYQEDILALKPFSKEREKLVKSLNEQEGLFGQTMPITRLSVGLLLFIFCLIIMLVLSAGCLLVLGYQLLIIIYMLLGIFVFLLALLPGFGIELVKRWAVKLISAASIKVLLVFALTSIVALMQVLMDRIDEYGFFLTILLIMTFFVVVYLKWREILSIFTNFNMNNVTNPKPSMNRMLQKDFNGLNYAQNNWNHTQEVFGNLKNSRTKEQDQKLDSIKTLDGWKQASQSSIKPSGTENKSKSKREKEEIASASIPAVTSSASHYENQSDMTDGIFNASKEIGQYIHKAEELLQQHYERSKEMNDQQAEVFVKRTEALRENGHEGFDLRDTVSMANLIKRKADQGIDPKELEAGDLISEAREGKRKVRRPKDLDDMPAVRHGAVEGIRTVESENVRQQTTGIEFLRENFGEEQGEQMFENFSRRYSSEAVERLHAAEGEKYTHAQIVKQLKQYKQNEKRAEEPGAGFKEMHNQDNQKQDMP